MEARGVGLRVKGSDRGGEASSVSLLEEVNPFFLFLAFESVHLFPLVSNSVNHQLFSFCEFRFPPLPSILMRSYSVCLFMSEVLHLT